jgi:hypothetical protein
MTRSLTVWEKEIPHFVTNDNFYYVAYLKILNSKLQEIEGLYLFSPVRGIIN